MQTLEFPMMPPNKITGANAGEPRRFAMRTHWAARVAQFWRSAGWSVTEDLNDLRGDEVQTTVGKQQGTRPRMTRMTQIFIRAICVIGG